MGTMKGKTGLILVLSNMNIPLYPLLQVIVSHLGRLPCLVTFHAFCLVLDNFAVCVLLFLAGKRGAQ